MVENKNDFTQGSIVSKLLRFMIPIFGALVLQAMYGAVSGRKKRRKSGADCRQRPVQRCSGL